MKLSVVVLPCARWRDAQNNWRQADDWGLHAGYTYDHLSWRTFRDKPWFSMVPTLVAAATVTSRLRLGPLVTSPNFRHPLVLAKDLIALDDVSSGRLTVGVGAGGTGFDSSVLGGEPWSTSQRHQHFSEFVRALDQLLREPQSNLAGPLYPVVDSRQIPGPVQSPRPPLYLSALGPRSLALTAALADGWISFGNPSPLARESTFDSVRAQITTLDDQLELRERSTSSLHRVFLDFSEDEQPLTSFEAFLDWAGRYGELGFNEVVLHWPVADSPYDYNRELFERICIEGAQRI